MTIENFVEVQNATSAVTFERKAYEEKMRALLFNIAKSYTETSFSTKDDLVTVLGDKVDYFVIAVELATSFEAPDNWITKGKTLDQLASDIRIALTVNNGNEPDPEVPTTNFTAGSNETIVGYTASIGSHTDDLYNVISLYDTTGSSTATLEISGDISSSSVLMSVEGLGTYVFDNGTYSSESNSTVFVADFLIGFVSGTSYFIELDVNPA